MLLSSRAKQIIVFLAEQTDYTTYEEVGKHIGISGRTVVREIATVEGWLNSQSIDLVRKSRYGMVVDASHEQKKELISQLGGEKVSKVYTSGERQDIILLELIQSVEELKQYYFSSILGVSEATVSQDLRKLDDRLSRHNLIIQRKPGLGMILCGAESDKRQLLLNVFYMNIDKRQVLVIIRKELNGENQNINSNSQAVRRLLYLISPKKLSKLELIVKKVVDKYDYPLADSSMLGLVVHLALALVRVENHETIDIDAELLEELKASEEFLISEVMLKEIGNEYKVEIPKEECGYITMHIKGARLQESARGKYEKELPNFDLVKLVNQIIDMAERLTNQRLNQDNQLFNGLMVHLKPMIIRMKMRMDIRNPLLDDIKTRYPAYFKLALRCQTVIEEYLGRGLPEEETGYICMHIGAAIERIINKDKRKARAIVTCTTGIGSSKMLAIRLQKEFPEIEVVDILSVIQINEEKVNRNTADFIISTVDMDYHDLPIVVVDPMLSDRDIDRLKDMQKELALTSAVSTNKKIIEQHDKVVSKVELIDTIDKQAEYGLAIKNFLNHTEYYFSDKIEIKQVLEEYLSNHIEKKYRETAFIEIMKREDFGSTIIEKDELAVFHNKVKGVSNLNSGIVNLKNPISYTGKDIKTIVIFVVPENITPIEIDVVSEISRQLILSRKFINTIKKGNKVDIESKIAEIYKKLLVQSLSK